MTFREAVEITPSVATRYRTGLRALKGADTDRIRCTDTRTLTGSIDLDAALEPLWPNEPRWDYGMGVMRAAGLETVIWVEVHPASLSHVREVIAKLQWLRGWLRTDAPALHSMHAEYKWIATGGVNFTAGSREARLLAKSGLSQPTKVLHVT